MDSYVKHVYCFTSVIMTFHSTYHIALGKIYKYYLMPHGWLGTVSPTTQALKPALVHFKVHMYCQSPFQARTIYPLISEEAAFLQSELWAQAS